MKTYSVLLTPEAETRLLHAFQHIQQDSPEIAERWLREVYVKIEALATLPRRCAVAREQPYFPDRELRQLIHHSHRVIFEVHDATSTVRVLYVRHGAERTVGESHS